MEQIDLSWELELLDDIIEDAKGLSDTHKEIEAVALGIHYVAKQVRDNIVLKCNQKNTKT